jgi:hypothetical protein
MELFGILLSVPAAFAASLFYCLFLVNVVVRAERLRRLIWTASVAVLVIFGIEVVLLATIGAVRSRGAIGPAFYAVHIALFFLGTPALANVLVLRKPGGVRARWYWAVPACTLFAFALVLLQYGVSEALYGIDGMNGPFSNRNFHRRADLRGCSQY